MEGGTTQSGLTGNLSRERLEGASAGRHGATKGRRYCDTVMKYRGLYWNPQTWEGQLTGNTETMDTLYVTDHDDKLKDRGRMCYMLLCRLC